MRHVGAAATGIVGVVVVVLLWHEPLMLLGAVSMFVSGFLAGQLTR